MIEPPDGRPGISVRDGTIAAKPAAMHPEISAAAMTMLVTCHWSRFVWESGGGVVCAGGGAAAPEASAASVDVTSGTKSRYCPWPPTSPWIAVNDVHDHHPSIGSGAVHGSLNAVLSTA